MKSQTIYGDGKTEVIAYESEVVFLQSNEQQRIAVSHAAMREIVIGWERHELRESEDEP